MAVRIGMGGGGVGGEVGRVRYEPHPILNAIIIQS